jgi:hypothetical protein
VRARMSAQLPEDVKRRRADYVIVNDGDHDDLRREVEFLLARFLRVGPLRPLPGGAARTITEPVPIVPESGSPAEPLSAGGTARLFGFPPAVETLVSGEPKPDPSSES